MSTIIVLFESFFPKSASSPLYFILPPLLDQQNSRGSSLSLIVLSSTLSKGKESPRFESLVSLHNDVRDKVTPCVFPFLRKLCASVENSSSLRCSPSRNRLNSSLPLVASEEVTVGLAAMGTPVIAESDVDVEMSPFKFSAAP
jgi:hypothetical protein